jgi:hypothetical protein
MDNFFTVLNLTDYPHEIQPAYVFDGLFILVGITAVSASFWAFRFHLRGRLVLALFAAIWLPVASLMSYHDIAHAHYARDSAIKGQFAGLEGCLDYFHPGSYHQTKGTAGNERWSVRGHEIEYGASQIRFGYHSVEPRGGSIHADTRVRIFFVRDYFLHRDDIIRLDVIQHACPPAPDKA